MKNFILWFFTLALIPSPLSIEPLFNFVVWDVGQGAWSTYYNADRCLHFDMGGEKFPWQKILQLCRWKRNEIYLTHEDWDHINAIKSFHFKVTKNCLFYPKPMKRKFPQTLQSCPRLSADVQILSMGASNKGRNASSVIYLLRNQVLISGDAPQKEENKWAPMVPKNLALLILGHHGSNTSSSHQLLKQTKPLLAIASARQKKYGHPHFKVKQRLKKQRVPMLRTETHGSIFLQIY